MKKKKSLHFLQGFRNYDQCNVRAKFCTKKVRNGIISLMQCYFGEPMQNLKFWLKNICKCNVISILNLTNDILGAKL